MTVQRICRGDYIFVVIEMGGGRPPDSFVFRKHQLDDVVRFEEMIVATTACITYGRVRLDEVRR